jgi:hypothetical protein
LPGGLAAEHRGKGGWSTMWVKALRAINMINIVNIVNIVNTINILIHAKLCGGRHLACRHRGEGADACWSTSRASK